MPAGVTETKAAIRRRMVQMPAPDWDSIIEQFLALPEIKQAQTIMLFYGVRSEADTRPLIKTLLRQGKRVVLPRCLSRQNMEGRAIDEQSELYLSAYGIPEPGEECPVVGQAEIDLILVPNLCCDRRGYRLGHGGGYYDRYLSEFSGLTVSLCPDEWLAEELPTDEWDVPMDIVLTQTQIRRRVETPRRISGEGAAIK